MLKILKAGLETTVQDFPGRVGLLDYGVSSAGPLDDLSFRLGNRLLDNPESAAGLEIQFVAPRLEFLQPALFAITGADNGPKLNNAPIPLWAVHAAKRGDVLSFGFPKVGARTYLNVAGGFAVPPVLGSRATHVPSGLGGLEGRALRDGDIVPALASPHPDLQRANRSLRPDWVPCFVNAWNVDVLAGPHDMFLGRRDHELFFSTEWKVSSKSNRAGYRLEGPEFEFNEKARDKPEENGSDPSNLIDYGCPLGAVNVCGQTPIIILHDGPSSVGYISPFTVISAHLRRVGQGRPGDTIRFKLASPEEAEAQRPQLPLAQHDLFDGMV